MSEPDDRRPLRGREWRWTQALAAQLTRSNVTADVISSGKLLFAALGAPFLLWAGSTPGRLHGALLLLAALCVILRLVCNLLDGMVTSEPGRAGPYGAIWKELPDRIADPLLLVAAGYSAEGAGLAGVYALGWVAALLAVLTAYVREMGRALGFPSDFSGPMATPQRMAILALACVVSMLESAWGWRGQTLAIALAVIVLGCLVTLARRILNLAGRLRERAGPEA